MSRETNTDCRKCKAPMPPAEPMRTGPFAGMKFTVTGYQCAKCDHWNNLKRRKNSAAG
jgi:ribosomal protein L40E